MQRYTQAADLPEWKMGPLWVKNVKANKCLWAQEHWPVKTEHFNLFLALIKKQPDKVLMAGWSGITEDDNSVGVQVKLKAKGGERPDGTLRTKE